MENVAGTCLHPMRNSELLVPLVARGRSAGGDGFPHLFELVQHKLLRHLLKYLSFHAKVVQQQLVGISHYPSFQVGVPVMIWKPKAEIRPSCGIVQWLRNPGWNYRQTVGLQFDVWRCLEVHPLILCNGDHKQPTMSRPSGHTEWNPCEHLYLASKACLGQ